MVYLILIGLLFGGFIYAFSLGKKLKGARENVRNVTLVSEQKGRVIEALKRMIAQHEEYEEIRDELDDAVTIGDFDRVWEKIRNGVPKID